MGSLGLRWFVLTGTLAVVGLSGSQRTYAQTKVEPTLVALAPETSRNVAVHTDVLNMVPDDALYLVVAGNVSDIKETVESVLRKLNVPFETDGYKQFNDFVSGLEGWDKRAMHALAFLPDADGDVTPAFFVPVTDYKKFAKSVGADPAVKGPTEYSIEDGPDGLIVEKGNIAILAQKDDKALLERIVASNSPIAKSMLPVMSFIGRNQVTGVMLPTGLKKGIEGALGGLEMIKGQAAAAGPQAATVARIFDAYATLLKTARDEMTILAAGVKLDETRGFDVGVHGVFKPGGKLATAVQKIDALPPQPLKGLPDGEFIIAGAGVFPGDLTKAVMEFSLGLASEIPAEEGGYNLTPEQIKELITTSQQAMAGLKRASFSMGVASESFYGGTCMLMETDDSAKFLAGYERAMASMAEIIKKNPSSTYPTQELARKKIDGRDVLAITTDMSKMIEKMSEKQPQLKGMYETMFGKDGKLTGYATTIDKTTVIMTYDEDLLKKTLAELKDGALGLAGNENVMRTAVMLHPRAQWVGFVSVKGYMELIKMVMSKAMAGAPGAPGGFPFQIPAFPAAAPIGISAQVAPAAMEMHLLVPMSLMESIRDFAVQMRAQFGG